MEGKRLDREIRSQYCISNPHVQELMLQHMIESASNEEYICLGQPDAFRPCQCEKCRSLYNTGDDWNEKLWVFHCKLAEGLQKVQPETKVVILAYQYTKRPPKTFRKFPANVMIMLTRIEQEILEEWNVYEVPAGFAKYSYNWGTYHLVNLLPKKTPAFIAREDKILYDNNIVGIFQDGYSGCIGLEGPAYYVFGRFFDDPENLDAEELAEEYYTAAFGEAVQPMRRFFTLFYGELQLYAEWLSPHCPTQWMIPLTGRKPESVRDPLDWVGKSTGRFGTRGTIRRIMDPDQMHRLVYPVGMLQQMEDELEKAEALATSEKVQLRLGLIRKELTYLKNITSVIQLYNAYRIQSDHANLERLLSAIDSWNALLDSYYDQDGHMKRVPGWPELDFLRGVPRSRAGLLTAKWWARKEKDDNPFIWDTREMREAL
jgi:hypothetical protein